MKIRKYNNDELITASDRLLGTDEDNSGATKNYLIGDLITFISGQLSEDGFIKIGDYYVDRKGGTNTSEILTNNIIYGIGNLFPNEYVIAVALQDNPTLEAHFDFKYRG